MTKTQQKSNECNTIKKDNPITDARMKKNKKRMLKELEKNFGIITSACTKVGINPSTYYRWLENDGDFKKEVDVVMEVQIMYVEDKLLGLIMDGNVSAIIFYLKCKHKDYKQSKINDTDLETRAMVDRALEEMRQWSGFTDIAERANK